MYALLKPGILISIGLRNALKHPLVGAFYAAPLGICLWVDPGPTGSAAAFWIGATLLLAVYYHACVIVGAMDAWQLVNGIASRLNEHDLAPLADEAARGGLDRRILRGQFGFMLNTLREAHRSLREIVSQARSSAAAVSTATGDIAAGNENLSRRTEQQAATLEQTAAGMEEFSATVKQTAANCGQASEASRKAAEVAHTGADAVHRVVGTMQRIAGSSREMTEIVSLIDAIAFQTNILALNAAVEAARAGEQGRGFAVVAAEVRALAQRSATAAKQIKMLIVASSEAIGEGNAQATAAGEVIDEMVAGVRRVNALLADIAVAASEQGSGVEEINKALVQLETMTQQNAALVEEASAASLDLNRQAQQLRGVVDRFQLEDIAAAAQDVEPRVRPRVRFAPIAR